MFLRFFPTVFPQCFSVCVECQLVLLLVVVVVVVMLSRMVFRPAGMGLLRRPAVCAVRAQALRPVVRCVSSLPGMGERKEEQPKRGMSTAVQTTEGAKETALEVRTAR